MPKIAIYNYITFFILSYDFKNEKPHLHFVKGKHYGLPGKIWLETLKFAETGDFSDHELNLIEKLVHKYQKQFIEIFNNYKSSNKKQRTLTLKLK
ncbi:MAG: hypothetical protein A3H98_04640 [Bacteroidetes bacterium RIFCSPLOWO2_02_FULL_36_8]|nr:MAG: hypothetical protein A3H98_04640 [Bacteroidetes bacterium RIFCSPLOWO2_02_FULL_36_8]OFY70656.1 MAG: hypothetical protein A3G23_07965 [Bacteroidetes bacterium RIFCSPLOWO2_12_FULL_37_12]